MLFPWTLLFGTFITTVLYQINGLVLERRNSSALAMDYVCLALIHRISCYGTAPHCKAEEWLILRKWLLSNILYVREWSPQYWLPGTLLSTGFHSRRRQFVSVRRQWNHLSWPPQECGWHRASWQPWWSHHSLCGRKDRGLGHTLQPLVGSGHPIAPRVRNGEQWISQPSVSYNGTSKLLGSNVTVYHQLKCDSILFCETQIK